jgi:hypothetical protein
MEVLRRYIAAILVMTIMTGCYKTIDIDDDTAPVLCMNSLISTGRQFTVALSHTWKYSDELSSDKVVVKDATIAVYVNDALVEKLVYDEDSCYQSTYVPKVGDKIRLVAESATYGSAEASVVMPDSVPFDNIKYEPVIGYLEHYDVWSVTQFDFSLNVKASFTDPEKSVNYYSLETSSSYQDKYFPNVDFTMSSLDTDIEPIFSEHISAIESVFGGETSGVPFFSDRQISGKDYTLHMRFNSCYYVIFDDALSVDDPYYCTVSLTLNSASEEYYNWMVYCWHLENGLTGALGDVGLGETMMGYSNVSTHAGVVAAVTPATYTIDLTDWIRENILKKLQANT